MCFFPFSFHQDKGERKSSFLQMGRGVDSNMGGEGTAKRERKKEKKHYQREYVMQDFFGK